MIMSYPLFIKNYIHWNKIWSGYLFLTSLLAIVKLVQMVFFPDAFNTSLIGLLLGWIIISEVYYGLIFSCLTITYLRKWFHYIGYVKIKRWPQYKAFIWNAKDLREQEEYFKGFPKEREIIVASAIRALNGDVYSVMKPGRHHHCIAMMHEHYASEVYISGNTDDNGFMTNTNRYIDRKEARELVIANGQAKYIMHPEELYSENLWDTPEEMATPVDFDEEELMGTMK